MLCNNCLKLPLVNQTHRCMNCPRLCATKQEKLCNYCSALKQICGICKRPITNNLSREEKVKTQIQKVHPFFGTGGCNSCGNN